jgi:F0F1-type ATP synthase membrane subunit b/b'
MTINLVIYTGIALIILGVILYGVACFFIKAIEKREREINKHIFEILRPKPKGKK